MSARAPSPDVLTAADALGVRPEALVALAGASGRTWSTGEHILRVGDAGTLDVEAAACAAAASVVPTPALIDRVDLDGLSAVLARRLSGTPAGDLDGIDSRRARNRGRACGRLHAVLQKVMAPPEVPTAVGSTSSSRIGPPDGDRLLHLDLHPFNVLLGPDDEVSGVLDWANAAAGPAVLDRARSFTILTMDPHAVARVRDGRWRSLVDGWAEAGEWDTVPPPAIAWACRFMLDDLSRRCSADQLEPVAAALRDAESSTGNTST
jgi:hypothetical protein